MGASSAGAEQTAEVDQRGEANFAFVDQNGTGNFGRIAQDGVNNEARADGDDSVADERDLPPATSVPNAGIAQTGADNQTTITQVGFFNRAKVTILGGAADRNAVTVTQADGPFGSPDASENFAFVGITGGDDNEVQVTQSGDDNAFSFRLDGEGVDGNTALTFEQSGDLNEAGGRIVGLSTGNTVDVVQSGRENLIGGAGSDAFDRDGIVIEGDMNAVTISQLSDGNRAQVLVTGSGNSAAVTQQ